MLSKIGNLETIKIDKLIDQSGILGGGEKAGEIAGKGFVKTFKQYGMADLVKLFSKQGFSTPQTPDWMNKGFFNQKSSSGVIKGLREITGKDLAKVFNLPDINNLEPKLDKLKVLTAGITTLFNPFVGARLLSDIVPKGGMSGGKGLSGAIFGAAGAAGYGEIFVAVKLLQTAFKLLVGAIQKTIQAYDDARKLYAKALTSGLGLNFTVKRSMIADILGVSETEVIRFGSAWNYLNQRIEFASNQLAKTATPLAGVGFEFKVMEKNISSLWSQIALGLAPAIKSLVSEFNDFMVSLGKSQVLEAVAIIISKIFQHIVDVVGILEIAITAVTTGIKLIADAFALAIAEIMNHIAKIPILGKYVATFDTGKIKDDMKSVSKSWADEVKNWAKNLNGAKLNDTPPPQAWMKQIPASTWEKMGLVTMGGSQNYAKDTSINTKQIAAGIRIIVAGIKRGNGGNPNFGMSQNTAQP